MPKVITYSSEEPMFLKMADGNEHPEGSREASKWANDDQGEGGKWGRRGVHVGWTKNGHVELGIAIFDPAQERASSGVFMTLDRDASNRIIRAIREARDAAYGKDA